jgi:hypothetical protein
MHSVRAELQKVDVTPRASSIRFDAELGGPPRASEVGLAAAVDVTVVTFGSENSIVFEGVFIANGLT